jgi:deoxyribose-phosphate aldolase
MTTANPNDLASRIESALFAPDATHSDVERVCAEAIRHSFHAVCVNTSWIELAYAIFEASNVQVVALVGFPLGATDTDSKRFETETAVDLGAHEIDFVLNVGRLKDGDHRYVLRELRDIVEAADERPVKVILEAHLLNREQTILACELTVEAGARFVCTSTDFHVPPVTVDQVKLLRETVGPTFGIKAAGGVRDVHTALALVEAGATRIGTTAAAGLVG